MHVKNANTVVEAAVVQLAEESKRYYATANEALLTSFAYAGVCFGVFALFSAIVPTSFLPSAIGLGGGGATGGMTVAWGFKERFDRRDKARQLDAQRASLQVLAQSPNLTSDDHDKIVGITLDLALRTVSAPYEFSNNREKTTGTK